MVLILVLYLAQILNILINLYLPLNIVLFELVFTSRLITIELFELLAQFICIAYSYLLVHIVSVLVIVLNRIHFLFLIIHNCILLLVFHELLFLVYLNLTVLTDRRLFPHFFLKLLETRLLVTICIIAQCEVIVLFNHVVVVHVVFLVLDRIDIHIHHLGRTTKKVRCKEILHLLISVNSYFYILHNLSNMMSVNIKQQTYSNLYFYTMNHK